MLSSRLQLHISRQVLKIFCKPCFSFQYFSFCSLFSFNLIKVLKILLNVSLQRINNCPVSGLYFDSRRINELYVFSSRLSFIVSMFIAHVTELVHRSTSIYVSTTLSIQNIRLLLYYVGFQNDFSYSDWNASRKWYNFFTILETFLHQRHLRYKF